MKKILYVVLALGISCNSTHNSVVKTESPAPEVTTAGSDPTVYANTITEQDLKDHLYTYASDEFEGRETGTPGQKKAVDYLRKHYVDLGIPAAKKDGDYFQKVPLEISGSPEGNITIGNSTYTIGDGVVTFAEPIPGLNEIVYAGYGIDTDGYSDYTNVDVKGKFVLVKIGEPKDASGKYLLTGNSKPGDWSNWRETLADRIEIAQKKGAVGVIYYDDAYYTRALGRYQYYKASDGGSISIKSENTAPATLFVDKNAALSIFPGIETDHVAKPLGKKISLDYENKSSEVDSENVVALIKGSEMPDEYLVISSHLDHIGVSPQGEVNNGADDDGSGSVALLEIAQAFKKAADEGHGPKRSIIFLHVTGEEKGLLGSEYYTDHPVIPLKQTVADLNIDMIGRIDPKREGDRNYVYLIGSDKLSTELHNLSEEVNAKYCNIDLDYKYNDDNDPNRFYYRSDHYNFAKHNVPIIFYFNGTHDDYHRPSDTPDKINYDLLANRAKLVFYTAWEVANRAQRITADKAAK